MIRKAAVFSNSSEQRVSVLVVMDIRDGSYYCCSKDFRTQELALRYLCTNVGEPESTSDYPESQDFEDFVGTYFAVEISPHLEINTGDLVCKTGNLSKFFGYGSCFESGLDQYPWTLESPPKLEDSNVVEMLTEMKSLLVANISSNLHLTDKITEEKLIPSIEIEDLEEFSTHPNKLNKMLKSISLNCDFEVDSIPELFESYELGTRIVVKIKVVQAKLRSYILFSEVNLPEELQGLGIYTALLAVAKRYMVKYDLGQVIGIPDCSEGELSNRSVLNRVKLQCDTEMEVRYSLGVTN